MARKHEREAIGARLRFEILRRCNFACYYCGVPAALGIKQLHIDHVIPVALGGTNDPWNLVSACWDCNAGKTASAPPEELVRRVRDEFCAYLATSDSTIHQCAYCHIPVEVDMAAGEEFYGDCSGCNELKCDSYEAGHRAAYEQIGRI